MSIEQTAITTMRTLAMDAVEEAGSGHPGTAMALAPVVYTVWQDYLRFDPKDPIWPNRDRFVLSVGHASTVLYTILHLAQVKAVNPEYETLGRPSITLDDLKRFRQIGSKAAGLSLDEGQQQSIEQKHTQQAPGVSIGFATDQHDEFVGPPWDGAPAPGTMAPASGPPRPAPRRITWRTVAVGALATIGVIALVKLVIDGGTVAPLHG